MRISFRGIGALTLVGLGLFGKFALGEPTLPANAAAVQALADKIDHFMAAGWKKEGVQAAPLADDAAFLRRIYLDLAGRIPNVSEARHFLADKNPRPRSRLIHRLLDSPRYATHFSTVWRQWWLPETLAAPEQSYLGSEFEAWMREQLTKNTAYDQMVKEILTQPAVNLDRFYLLGGNARVNPAAFYQVKQNKPDELAAGVARSFLGIKLECAQCHDHPFADWRREQFWGLAAFFAGLPRGYQLQEDGSLVLREPSGENFDRRELTIPGTERVVKAAFLDGKAPKWQAKVSPRVTLADWVTARDNPYFARAAVNRVWSYFFGAGLIEPVDEIVGGQSKCSHPDLLNELARQFVDHYYDLKFLVAAITTSRTYQLSSAGKETVEPHLFARIPVRGMTPEQLWDSLAMATGFVSPRNGPLRDEFLARFARAGEKASEQQISILQALTLMNGKIVRDATSLQKSETLGAVVDAPFMKTAARIETLYLATLSRPPRPVERERMARYVDGGGSAAGQKNLTPAARQQNYQRALADVFWVLLNSSEFVLNH